MVVEFVERGDCCVYNKCVCVCVCARALGARRGLEQNSSDVVHGAMGRENAPPHAGSTASGACVLCVCSRAWATGRIARPQSGSMIENGWSIGG